MLKFEKKVRRQKVKLLARLTETSKKKILFQLLQNLQMKEEEGVENSRKFNLEVIFYWTHRAWEEIERK